MMISTRMTAGGDVKSWLDSRYILNEELMGFFAVWIWGITKREQR